MNEPKVTLSVQAPNNQTRVISIQGEINSQAEAPLMEAYAQASEQGVKAIILDFSNMEYMNSSGIGLLVTLLIRANRQRQRLMACGLSEHYKQIFDLTRLNEAIAIYDTQEAAVAAGSL